MEINKPLPAAHRECGAPNAAGAPEQGFRAAESAPERQERAVRTTGRDGPKSREEARHRSADGPDQLEIAGKISIFRDWERIVAGPPAMVEAARIPSLTDTIGPPKSRPTRERGCSSAGRAPQSHCGGQRFDPAQLHHPVRAPSLFVLLSKIRRIFRGLALPISVCDASKRGIRRLCAQNARAVSGDIFACPGMLRGHRFRRENTARPSRFSCASG